MANYIFLPVNSGEMQGFARNISNFLGQNGAPITGTLTNPYESGWKKGAMRRFGQGCLRAEH